MNELSGNLEANIMLFANDTSTLNKDLDEVIPWANKWKMSFKPDPPKQTQEVIFFTENNQNISITNSIAFRDIF